MPSPSEQHHPCGPSSLFRRKQCPGSLQMEEGLPECSNKFAEEGTLLHEAVWVPALRKDLEVNQLEALEVIDQGLAKFTEVTEWEAERRVECYDFEANRFAPPRLFFGTADGLGRLSDPKTIIIPEFKFGFVEVEPPHNNLQLAAESLAFHQELGIERAITVLFQPRVSGEPKIFEFTEFGSILENIRDIIHRAEADEIILKAGMQCTYCKAKKICPAARKCESVIETVCMDLVTPDNAGEMLAKLRVVEKRCAEIRERIREVVEAAGGKVDGAYMRDKRGRRFISDVQGAYNSVSEYFDVQEFMELFCKLSVTEFENETARRLKGAGVVKNIKEGKKTFAECIDVEHHPTIRELHLTK